MAFIWLANLVNDLLLRPWMYNKLSFEFGYLSGADLEFLPYEDEALLNIIPIKDTLVFIFVLALLYNVLTQWNCFQRERTELEQLYRSCWDMETSSKVFKFTTETERLTREIENRNKALENRFKKAESMVKNNSFYEVFKDDLDETRSVWNLNISSFGLIDLKADSECSGEWAQRMELFDIEQEFDAAINEINGEVEEMVFGEGGAGEGGLDKVQDEM